MVEQVPLLCMLFRACLKSMGYSRGLTLIVSHIQMTVTVVNPLVHRDQPKEDIAMSIPVIDR